MLNPVSISQCIAFHRATLWLHLASRSGYQVLLLSQVRELFPSARGLEMTWHSIVKIQQSLYREVRCGRAACLVLVLVLV
jgi:hypothetical protein